MNKTGFKCSIAIIFLISFLFIYCKKTDKNITLTEKELYYKMYSENDSLLGYSMRKYEFRNNTIIEKYISINLNGKKKNKYLRDFYRNGADIYISSNIQNDKNKYLFFSPTIKDTCYFIDRKLDNFYLCAKGKINFKNHQNVYKVYYDERGSHPRKETLILDQDYTILARFEDCYGYQKEIVIENSKTIANLKIKFQKEQKKILWW